MTFSFKQFSSKCDQIRSTGEMLNGKCHFFVQYLCLHFRVQWFFSVMFAVNSGGSKQFLILIFTSDVAICIDSELYSILFLDLKGSFYIAENHTVYYLYSYC